MELHHHAVDLCAGQVNFVDDRDDGQVVFQREQDIADGLRFHPLRGIHEQQRAFTRGQATRDFIREIHMAGRVDEVEFINPPIRRAVIHANGVRLDGDARSRSRSMLSSTWSCIWNLLKVCVCSSKRSAKVDFPWSICAIMEKFRMFWRFIALATR